MRGRVPAPLSEKLSYWLHDSIQAGKPEPAGGPGFYPAGGGQSIPAITSISTSRPSSIPATATQFRAGRASGKNFR